MDDDNPFGIGQDLIVEIPVDPRGRVNIYNDDYCGLTVDIDDNATRLERAPLLALPDLTRTLDTNNCALISLNSGRLAKPPHNSGRLRDTEILR